MRIGRYVLAALFVLGFAGMAYAAPVGLTSEADATAAELWTDKNINVSVGFVADIVSGRAIDIDKGDFEMKAYVGRIGLGVLDRFNFYLDLGEAADMEYNCELRGENVRYQYDDDFLWGVGGSALIYRWENGIEVGASASYRSADMCLSEVQYDTQNGSVIRTKSQITARDGELQEWQAAVEVGWRTRLITPYLGVKYSDVEVDGDFTIDGETRNASGRNASMNAGVFVGCTITPKIPSMPKSEQLALNVEGRFLDEEAVNFGVTYKF